MSGGCICRSISVKRNVFLHVLNVTVCQVREKLQESMMIDMREYKPLINEEMLIVMRQMDSASKILSYLYLGSEWNASNLDELQENRFCSVSFYWTSSTAVRGLLTRSRVPVVILMLVCLGDDF